MDEQRLDRQPPYELLIVGTGQDAQRAGFPQGHRHHPRHTGLLVWSLDWDPDFIRGRELARVTVADSARRMAFGRPYLERQLHQAISTAKMMLRIPPMLWIEL